MDEVTYHNSVKLPCNDIYCKPCLRQMFVNATNDEAAYPPKCCKLDIPLTEVLRPCFGVLSKVQVKEFKERAEEYETAKRVYCHKCGKFIKKRHVKMKVEQAKCIKCKEATCIHCGKDVHEGDCPEDEGMQKLLELSKQEKWTRCSKCKRFVEKVVGCDHITCPCGYQFCYLCGALWELAHPCYMD
ncbi:hypothetical protein BJ508DRAFT_207407 [Ascobolus immersus RN42]|uniref:RBR-type E3 ubiquitin transferase n=1 Tax=Ascobolus immersus RN42 TaxID=1160509 RepID=A0A3N4IER9_ASCIM|nr:hypothetical protein BJ508DRAFT_207407 [Ascobolus immersus RN42]